MKVVILAGGYGTRLSEESYLRPKPMIEIGGKPILWHIMKHYSYYGYNDFIICAGYKQHIIKEWFDDYFLHNSDITFSFKDGQKKMIVHNQKCEPWDVTVVDTGLDTNTAGRVRLIKDYVGNERFMLTYGDGVSDVDLDALLEFHINHKKIATLTSVIIEENKGVLSIDDDVVKSFREKSMVDSARINGGFFILEPEVFNYIKSDSEQFEREPMDRLVSLNEVVAYRHNGFWQCMDTKREKEKLERMWALGKAPWKTWDSESENGV